MRFLKALAAFAPLLLVVLTLPANAQKKPDLMQMLLHDPDAPIAGNPDGDVAIVAFLDYNCPFCRRSTPQLDKFIASDPNVKVIYKD